MIDVAYWNFAALEGLRADDRLRVLSRAAMAVMLRLVLVARGDGAVPYLNHHTGLASVRAYDLRESDLTDREEVADALAQLQDVGLVVLDDEARMIRLDLHEGLLSREGRTTSTMTASADDAPRSEVSRKPSDTPERVRARKLRSQFGRRVGPFRGLDVPAGTSWESWSTTPAGVAWLAERVNGNAPGTPQARDGNAPGNAPENAPGTPLERPGTPLSPTPPLQKRNGERTTEQTQEARAEARDGNAPGTPPRTPPVRPDGSGAPASLSLVPPGSKLTKKVTDVERVFAHWRTAMDHPRSVLDAKRQTLIQRALKTWNADELCRAIDGYASSAWHRGENDRGRAFDGLDLILRDAAHVEKGWELDDEANAARAAAEKTSTDLWLEGLRKMKAETAARMGARAGEVSHG